MPLFPHEQSHVSIVGLFAPQLLQKLPVIFFAPQVQFQVSVSIFPTFCPIETDESIAGDIASFVILITLPIAPSVTPNPATSPIPPDVPDPPVIPFCMASIPTIRDVSC